MRTLRFFASALYPALLLPVYIRWAQRQAEAQIDKMQEAAFNTPGAESPVTPPVLLAGAALLGSHLLLGRALLRLSAVLSFLSLLVGGAAGAAFFWWQPRGSSE